MGRIKNKNKFGIALIFTALTAVCLAGWFIAGKEMRFLAALAVAFVFALLNYYSAFAGKGALEEINAECDERDEYLTFKASNTALKIINGMLTAGCLGCLILQVVLHSQLFMTAAITLAAVIVMIFVIMLLTSVCYEKKN